MTTGASPNLIQAAVEYLTPRLPFVPDVGIVLGSGLGALAERQPGTLVARYDEIPGFAPCRVEGHAGRLILTDGYGPRVAILQGRVHRYEGHPLDVVSRPVRVLAALGVRTVILTCSAGALGDAEAGELLLVDDHLNLLGDNPLAGAHREEMGEAKFVEMAGAYDAQLLDVAERCAAVSGIRVRRGVLAGMLGPTYETPAEAGVLAQLGARAVSMSLVPETIVARSLGLRVLGLAVLTNRAGGRMEGHGEVVASATRLTATVGALLECILARAIF